MNDKSQVKQYYSVDSLVEETMPESVKLQYFELQLAETQKRAQEFATLQSQLTRLQSANESQAEVIGKFEDAVAPDLCVSEAIDGIRKIKLQLTQAQADNARLSESHNPHEG